MLETFPTTKCGVGTSMKSVDLIAMAGFHGRSLTPSASVNTFLHDLARPFTTTACLSQAHSGLLVPPAIIAVHCSFMIRGRACSAGVRSSSWQLWPSLPERSLRLRSARGQPLWCRPQRRSRQLSDRSSPSLAGSPQRPAQPARVGRNAPVACPGPQHCLGRRVQRRAF